MSRIIPARPGRAVRLGVLGAIAILLMVGAYRLVGAIGRLNAEPCAGNDSFPGIVIVGGCIAGFALGHLAGRVRNWQSPRVQGGATRVSISEDAAWANRLIVRGVLAVFLLLVAAVLAYETVALWNPLGLRPITSYIRCAKTIDPGTTMVVAIGISILVGHWFWYPTPQRRREPT